jgi:hypothetical protein
MAPGVSKSSRRSMTSPVASDTGSEPGRGLAATFLACFAVVMAAKSAPPMNFPMHWKILFFGWMQLSATESPVAAILSTALTFMLPVMTTPNLLTAFDTMSMPTTA